MWPTSIRENTLSTWMVHPSLSSWLCPELEPARAGDSWLTHLAESPFTAVTFFNIDGGKTKGRSHDAISSMWR